MDSYREGLEQAILDTIGPDAAEVDATGAFPRRSIDALAELGLLGLTLPEAAGGGGGGLGDAVEVIRQLAAACGSTAMVVLMHYAATAALRDHGPEPVRKAIADGSHLTTLAFSEAGSRSHFWAPLGTATATDSGVRLDARKSWVTAAGVADSYVWSSRPLAAAGPMTLWSVDADAPGLSEPGRFDGLGLRGNCSAPITADGVIVAPTAMLGEDGAGLDLAMAEVLPWFLVLSGAFSVGLMDAVVEETGNHLRTTRLEHMDVTLAEVQLPRVDHARMRIAADQAAALLGDTLRALASGDDDAMLRVLEVKAAAGEASITVTDLAMKVCGGAAFRRELGIERRFRDAQAARVMAPTTDALLDFIGRVGNGLPLM
jgi:alkylation response protein AidB-like acyl-CoA dehydrogenase